MIKKNYFLIGSLFLIFLLRIVALNKFPIGITHDELNYVFSAKSLYLTQDFPPGTAPSIIPSTMKEFSVTVAEVPTLILAPFIGPLNFSLFNSRIIGVFLSVLLSLAIYLIVESITKKKSYAFICLLLTAINPWSFLMGRTIFEVNFFVTFFLWGFWVLIKNRGRNIFKALPLYLAGFMSYLGGQVVFFIFIISNLLFHYNYYQKPKKDKIYYAVFASISLLLLIAYLIIVFRNQSYQARGSEIFLPSNTAITQEVNKERFLTMPAGVNNLFINKGTLYMKEYLNKYLNAYSVDNLFINGEVRAAFSLQKHGNFYYLDFLFILMGLAFLYSINKKFWTFTFFVLITVPITSGLSIIEHSYSQRSGLIYPFLIILSGIGVGGLLTMIKSTKFRKIVGFILISVYLIFFINLLHTYFFRFPVYASDGWFFQDRVLSKYLYELSKLNSGQSIFVYSSEPKILFEEFLFYNNSYNSQTAELINKQMNEEIYVIGNITFLNSCPEQTAENSNVVVKDANLACDESFLLEKPLRITRLRDASDHFLIYNDHLCVGFVLNKFIPQKSFGKFDVENQTPEEFCVNWITKL